MAYASDIVGYTYRADYIYRTELYCPGCILAVVNGLTVDHAADTAERDLDVLAAEHGIDRYDESTFDSGDFPKVVTRDMLRKDVVPYVTHTGAGPLFHPHHAGIFEPDRCGSCGEVLGS
jgi:hypothetical protein